MDLFEKVENDYITFPTTLKSYTWFKPILVLVIALVSGFFVFPSVLTPLYIIFDPNYIQELKSPLALIPCSFVGLSNFVNISFLILAVYIPTKLIYRIPFSEMVAPIRNWNWMALFKSLLVGLVVYGIFEVIYILMVGKPIVNQFTILTFIVFLILLPIQCFAEEFMAIVSTAVIILIDKKSDFLGLNK